MGNPSHSYHPKGCFFRCQVTLAWVGGENDRGGCLSLTAQHRSPLGGALEGGRDDPWADSGRGGGFGGGGGWTRGGGGGSSFHSADSNAALGLAGGRGGSNPGGGGWRWGKRGILGRLHYMGNKIVSIWH